MKNSTLLLIGAILIALGLIKPDIDLGILKPTTIDNNTICVVDPPSEDVLLNNSQQIVKILQSSDDSTRSSDCLKLSSLYCDMATLIELDEEDVVIKDTSDIRQANILAGKMLRLDIKDKYPGLAEKAKELLIEEIGDEDVALDEELRKKSINAFRALSWSFYEGSK